MNAIVADENLVASCGLYCGACRRYLQKKCGGCRANEKATWCKVRTCCGQNGLSSCAECQTFSNPMACKFFNNFMSKLFGLLFKSDRAACIDQIKQLGVAGHGQKMASLQLHTIKRS